MWCFPPENLLTLCPPSLYTLPLTSGLLIFPIALCLAPPPSARAYVDRVFSHALPTRLPFPCVLPRPSPACASL
ncbi:hypothetical protein E2C01_084384 [Portunus trituberculatus]|uniref:Uncharacterized protein n=1 Tax=Portunus trituberculatus TaxID=210409 RepID=A0A5B7J936_PORTR|nr:hypothetical protein [Portunus trituberculatus]